MEKINGAYYGVPIGFVPLSVIYNKTLFRKAGISTSRRRGTSGWRPPAS